jgi:hypothetical protein
VNEPFHLDIGADRWVACIRTIPLVNADLTDAVFKMQVRAVPDVGGDPLVDLDTVTTSSAEGVRLIDVTTGTIAAHITAGRLGEVPKGVNPSTGVPYATTDSVTLSRIGIRINETTMEGLPFPGEGNSAERGDDVPLVWDMHITPSGGIKDKYFGGAFTVRAGATQ